NERSDPVVDENKIFGVEIIGHSLQRPVTRLLSRRAAIDDPPHLVQVVPIDDALHVLAVLWQDRDGDRIDVRMLLELLQGVCDDRAPVYLEDLLGSGASLHTRADPAREDYCDICHVCSMAPSVVGVPRMRLSITRSELCVSAKSKFSRMYSSVA